MSEMKQKIYEKLGRKCMELMEIDGKRPLGIRLR